jgi:phosphatidylglycerophosphate synthase
MPTHEPGLKYTAVDRSVLLPLYKKLLVGPLLPAIPARVPPNSITHAGHLINLVGTAVLMLSYSAQGGWPFFFAAAMLHVYNWCDNADGGHARRTNQCSATGEFLDHGLDVLNATYIAYLSAISIGAGPIGWVVVVVTILFASAQTYWEQAETGVFHLGRLNQIESVFALGTILVVAGVFGVDVWERVSLGPVTLKLAIMTFVCGTAVFGGVRGTFRVWRAKGRLVPAIAAYAFGVAVLAAAFAGALSTVAAVIVATSGYGFLGLRSLAMRVEGRRPVLERGVMVAAALVAGLTAWKLAGGEVGRGTDIAASVLAGTFFGVLAVANARDGRRRVAALDRAAKA